MKSHIRAKFDEAVLLKEASEFDAARKILLELYKWDSASPTLLAVLADVCWELGHFDEAISFFQQAVALRPNSETISLRAIPLFLGVQSHRRCFCRNEAILGKKQIVGL